MKIRDKFKEQTGFTIIEVMIVLAIAAVIMLIVFLAIPALQRNSRNTQRSNDAARIAGAINECLANNNGNLTLCDNPTVAADSLDDYLDMADNQQLINFAATAPVANNVDTAYVRTGLKCDGNATQGAGARAFVVQYNVETSAGQAARCVGS